MNKQITEKGLKAQDDNSIIALGKLKNGDHLIVRNTFPYQAIVISKSDYNKYKKDLSLKSIPFSEHKDKDLLECFTKKRPNNMTFEDTKK